MPAFAAIFIQTRFAPAERCALFMPKFEAPGNYKDPVKKADYIQTKRDSWLAEDAAHTPFMSKPSLMRMCVHCPGDPGTISNDYMSSQEFCMALTTKIKSFMEAGLIPRVVGLKLRDNLARICADHFMATRVMPPPILWDPMSKQDIFMEPLALLGWMGVAEMIGPRAMVEMFQLPHPAEVTNAVENDLMFESLLVKYAYATYMLAMGFES